MECADVPDVSSAVGSDDLSNVVSRAEALRQLGFSTDKMVGDNKVLTARCRWYGIPSVAAEFQNSVNCVGNRCRSHDVCRVKATSTVVHFDDHTCECDNGFELKSTARVVAYQLPSTMLSTCSRMPLSPRKLSSTSVMCSACRVRAVTAESRRGICRATSGARPREHCAMRASPPTDSQHQLSRRYCISRAQLEEELKLRTRPEEAYAEELVKLTVRTRELDFMQVQFSSDTQDEVFTSLWIKKLEVLVGDAEISCATQMSCVGRSLKMCSKHLISGGVLKLWNYSILDEWSILISVLFFGVHGASTCAKTGRPLLR